jgi:hypothetical protein
MRQRRELIQRLLAFAALTFWVASAIHFGVTIPLGVATISDPFRGAAIPEAFVGAVVAAGALALWSGRAAAKEIASGTAVFAILVTLYGLSVTVRAGRAADEAYHVSVLVILMGSLGLLYRDGRRRNRS